MGHSHKAYTNSLSQESWAFFFFLSTSNSRSLSEISKSLCTDVKEYNVTVLVCPSFTSNNVDQYRECFYASDMSMFFKVKHFSHNFGEISKTGAKQLLRRPCREKVIVLFAAMFC